MKWKMSATFRERTWDIETETKKTGKNVLAHLILNDVFSVWTPHPELPFSAQIGGKRDYDSDDDEDGDGPKHKMTK
jgi:hypothetical protein